MPLYYNVRQALEQCPDLPTLYREERWSLKDVSQVLTPPVDPKTAGKYLVALGVTLRQGDFEEQVSVCVCLSVLLLYAY
jgi:hypothetical protein